MTQEKPASTSSEKKPLSSRRDLLAMGGVAGLAAAGFYAWPAIQGLFPHRFAFEPIPWPAGFRRIAAGQISAASDPLAGIEDTQSDLEKRAAAWVRENPCTALFGPDPIAPGTVPIASFSDYNCPYCRVLSRLLIEQEERTPGQVRITWHEWPTLGLSSRIMARAALAARRQGGYLRFHHTLMRTRFLPDSGYLADLAKRKGLDPELLLADMRSPEIAGDVARSAATAALLGFRGTPSLVVGRTAVSGAIGKAELASLIRTEREAGPPPGCA